MFINIIKKIAFNTHKVINVNMCKPVTLTLAFVEGFTDGARMPNVSGYAHVLLTVNEMTRSWWVDAHSYSDVLTHASEDSQAINYQVEQATEYLRGVGHTITTIINNKL